MVERVVHRIGQSAQKVHHALIEAGLRVGAAIVFHTDVDVGDVEEADGEEGHSVRCQSVRWRSVEGK